MTKQQNDMIEALGNCYVNVSKASKIVGIDRTTHYLWLNNNQHYKQLFDDLQESMIDIAETMLMTNIEDAKETSIIFFLKTKGKKRGYQETLETTTIAPKAPIIEVEQ